ncbi:MAG: hypothetical protein P8Y26_13195, partial [Gemmatimonadales bacterium]
MNNCDPFEGKGVGFYRCLVCGKVCAPWDLPKYHGCRKCGSVRLRTTNLSFFEKIIEIIRQP